MALEERVSEETVVEKGGKDRKPSGKKLFNMSEKTKDTITGVLFVSPQIIGVTVLIIIPIIMAFVVSFTDYVFVRGFGDMNFVGFENYITMFADQQFIQSLINNVIMIAAIPVGIVISLLLAVIINNHVYFKSFFRVVYFMPYISSIVAIAVVFQLLFHPSNGPINEILMSLGVNNPPGWLADSDWALFTIMFIMIWTNLGFQFIIYLAALQGIPKDLYEVADIEGASFWDKFRKITFPMISPVTFFLFIIGVINSFKVFDIIQVLTAGGPNYATSSLVYYIYEQSFLYMQSGYGSAISIILFLLLLVLTIVNWYGQKKWVHY